MLLSKLSKYFFSKDHLLLIIGTSLLGMAGVINIKNPKPLVVVSKQDTALNINKDLLIFMSAGNKRLMTDLLWVQTLLESDLDHYKKRDLNNWLFLRFNTISVLDPRFYENYLYGGQFLNVAKDDILGAEIIYNKGLNIFPDDYALNYFAGILNYFELSNNETALKYLKRIENHPRSPVFLKSIIHKLELAQGASLEEIYGLVFFHYESTKDEVLKIKLKSDLYAIKAEIDLKCLNNNRESCDTRDLDGDYYLKENGQYKTQKPFLLFRLTKRGETMSPQARKKVDTIK
jgi:tetratricopeptide (TPR) repeat protein